MTTTAEPIEATTYSAQEAADMCGVNKKTILRKAAKLRELGAVQDENGYWQITVAHMLGLGLTPNRYKAADPDAGETLPVPEPPAAPAQYLVDVAVAQAELRTARVRINELDAELRELREEKATFRARAEAAEAVAQEREYTINDLRRERQLIDQRLTHRWSWLRRPKELTAGPLVVHERAPEPVTATPATPPTPGPVSPPAA